MTTDSDVQTEEWKTISGCSAYQCSRDSVWERGPDGLVLVTGGFRSVDRVDRGGRRRPGKLLSARLWGRYVMVDLRTDEGVKVTRTVHSVILETFDKPLPEGMECRHYDDNPLNNRFRPGTEEESVAAGGNLFPGTPDQNRADGWRNNPPPPKPVRLCAPHNRPVAQGSRLRCKVCVAETGEEAAKLLRQGLSPAEAAVEMAYPNADTPNGEWLYSLAVKHGGYRPPGRARRTLATLRDRLWREGR
jgi:hypothetical protein